MTHWTALILMVVLISVAFAFLMREKPKDRVILGLKMLIGFILFTLIAGWIAFFIP